MRLDDEPGLTSCNSIDFIKLDTEGNELAVLRGAKELIRRNKPLLMIEMNGCSERFFKTSEQDLRDFLRNEFDGEIQPFGRVNWNYFFYFPNS